MRVDEAGGYFDRYGGEGRAELFLEQDFGAVGFVQEGDDADAVDFGGCGAGLGMLESVVQGGRERGGGRRVRTARSADSQVRCLPVGSV